MHSTQTTYSTVSPPPADHSDPADGGTWFGAPWFGATWFGATWFGATWFGATWFGATWFGGTWFGTARRKDGGTWFETARPAMATALCALLAIAMFNLPSGSNQDAFAQNSGPVDASVGILQTSSTFGVESSPAVVMNGMYTSGYVNLRSLERLTIQRGYFAGDGSGIDVALIDTGVAPVVGLGSDRVLHGPDLSSEGIDADLAHLDTYGHGTHIAGIIAGDRYRNSGIAPGARIVSVKVAGSDGLTTVPQVVAGIDWVVENRNANGLNIRVLNLSLGQQDVSNHVGDELSAAVERAWNAGVFVVTAAGNEGESQYHLDSPAIDPYVVAVGAADSLSSRTKSLYAVPAWSAQGDGQRNPDLVAAGRSIASYRVPGSTLDTTAPWARAGQGLFLGSGTSQAAAAVSGAAAVILSSAPHLTNDELKATMVESTDELMQPAMRAGNGLVDVGGALAALQIGATQSHASAGTTATTDSWTDGSWNGNEWSGGSWSGATWSATWSGATWSGGTWSGATWSGATWSGGTWSGATWSGYGWSQ